MSMKSNLIFRSWYYFRQGWGLYFAFIFAAINTMVVTYYLAIDKVPILKEVFPTFGLYLATLASFGIPLMILVGYIHYKRSSAISEEFEVTIESNPYWYKIPPGWNKEVVFPLYLLLTTTLIKLSKNEKLSDEEIKEMTELQYKINKLLEGGYLGEYWKEQKRKK